jgi:hypothetical protein
LVNHGPAEIAFYTTKNNRLEKIVGKYFGSPQITEEHIRIMTDGDILSYVEVLDFKEDMNEKTGKFILKKEGQPIWIAMELDTTTKVTHVGICPRNDKNGVYPGMRYELFYWDKEWKSLGRKKATGDSAVFEEIPQNSVLWLRNLDEGREERIFTMKDGEQVWW